jgi:hypothetical protein
MPFFVFRLQLCGGPYNPISLLLRIYRSAIQIQPYFVISAR